VSLDSPARDGAKPGQTGRTLLWAGLFLLLVGGALGAPEAGVACSALAALCALPAIVAGPRRSRIVGAVVLIGAAALATALLPGARRGLESYRGRAQRPPAPAATQPR
jgi:hypothetical protein